MSSTTAHIATINGKPREAIKPLYYGIVNLKIDELVTSVTVKTAVLLYYNSNTIEKYYKSIHIWTGKKKITNGIYDTFFV